MEALKRKWNSCRGASILLALLFLLVCVMVGASILAAAASNAGKIKSNKEEQQNYLTLSSALTLLCDELESVKYVGKYNYIIEETAQMDESGDIVRGDDGQPVYDITDTTYRQTQGELRYRGTDSKVKSDDWSELQAVLPLYNDLDSIFAEKFDSGEGLSVFGTGPYTLTLQVSGGGTDGLYQTVKVTVDKIGGAGIIYLHASLDSDSKFQMRATMEAVVDTNYARPNALSRDNSQNTSGTTTKSETDTQKTTTTEYTTGKAVTWKLKEIVKETVTEAGGDSGG